MAWTPPLGIPSPPFGVSEEAPPVPAPWSAETAGFYFVNGEKGTDEGRTYGTASAPRATIPNPGPAGAVVRLVGVYREGHTGARRLRLGGTASGPCFVQGAPGEPILVSWTDAETMFHEFGHALHGLSSNVTCPSLAGTAVVRDYVQFASQLLEHWLSTPEVLNRFAIARSGVPHLALSPPIHHTIAE